MSLLSVSEYANKTNKDPGNIRRLLAEGRLQGKKIGKQWVLDEDTQYPTDQRVVSGIYKNSRKKKYFNADRILASSVRGMIKELQDIYGSHLFQTILYGSYARGDETEESDVDIALLVEGKIDPEMTEKMIICVARRELECGRVLSVVDIDNKKYSEWSDTLPFYRNLKKEGIVLWTRN
ncbi:MAG: nucleotidyltransferase domain-containing protein [Spirochaetales bacterium]|nr:nucleotidyltransferase domain-containing protein [Spirochaetales bacterium]MBO7349133.1 nucleotidyltransferase domain-containing protein [Spirochaetales bacterium]MBP5756778.1 nucleotidyltransferase domain-containing protein [Spirochaetales bacterium]